jgi:hypothetical protein
MLITASNNTDGQVIFSCESACFLLAYAHYCKKKSTEITAMNDRHPSSLDLILAKVCMNCPVCRHARLRQSGPVFQLVKQVETKVCPFCRAYERVYGRKAHAARPNQPTSPQGGTPPMS